MSLVGKTYQWGSWDITFKENDVLESVGGYNGKGTYKCIEQYKYSININNTEYTISFEKNKQYHEFISVRCNNGNIEKGFNYATSPYLISLVGKTYQWGSWDITFKERGVLESVGEYTGKGTYRCNEQWKYSLHINNTEYTISFEKNKRYNEFISVRGNNGNKEEGFNYADYPNKKKCNAKLVAMETGQVIDRVNIVKYDDTYSTIFKLDRDNDCLETSGNRWPGGNFNEVQWWDNHCGWNQLWKFEHPDSKFKSYSIRSAYDYHLLYKDGKYFIEYLSVGTAAERSKMDYYLRYMVLVKFE